MHMYYVTVGYLRNVGSIKNVGSAGGLNVIRRKSALLHQQTMDRNRPAIASIMKKTTALPFEFLYLDQLSLQPVGIQPEVGEFVEQWRTLGQEH
jgi:hypothetical protein